MIIDTTTFYEQGGFRALTVKAECPFAYAESIAEGRDIVELYDEVFGRVLKVGNGGDASYTMIELKEAV